jgi:hypothetical protein
VLAPESYADGMDAYLSAVDRLEKGRDVVSVREHLAEAKRFFQTAVEAARLARTTFPAALTARGAAEKAGSTNYSARDWERAEDALMAAAAALENGKLNKATEHAREAQQRYHETEQKALAAKARVAL